VFVKTSGLFAEYRDRTFGVVTSSDTWVSLLLVPGQADDFPVAIGRGRRGDDVWVKLPMSAIERLWDVQRLATWRTHPVVVERVDDGRALISFRGGPAAAEALGLEGSRRDGYGGRVPESELTDVRDERKEIS
jgi:hypothetical protein